ncbi:hypothetical protein thalar_01771 [Litoreibacter arenae DSM 19593]|uniref:HPr kinase n=1 Tax=Litoreibacter arenae DSM 19593 TaxID=1123360 RepID=S9RLE7_9RHOB|nr:hypothetical protein thalar_01771 [Litoreibacter arenae DSM 19593]
MHFGPYASLVEFDDCDDLLEGFKSILRGWHVREVSEQGTPPPIIRFSKRDGRFQWQSERLPPPDDWSPRGPRKVMDGVADFHYRFLDWHALEFTNQFCLHCAAVRVGGGLVIFPSGKKAGKSTLVTELALRGYQIFCDDVLPIELGGNDGLAMGILPRLRLPLPENISPDHSRFVDRRMGLADRYAAYINFRPSELAAFGTTAPIRAIVLLRRSDAPVSARLLPAGRAETLARMIDQNFATHLSPTLIFDEMSALMDRAELRTLEFSDVGQAAQCIAETYGGGA